MSSCANLYWHHSTFLCALYCVCAGLKNKEQFARKAMHLKKFAKNSVIIKQGEVSEHVYFVKEGQVRVIQRVVLPPAPSIFRNKGTNEGFLLQ